MRSGVHPHAELRTDRLRLRRIAPQDVDAVASLSSDPEVHRHSPTGAPTLDAARAVARAFVDDWVTDGIGYWVVEYGGQMVGISGLKAVSLRGEPLWNLYYRYSPEVWGQGIAREAAAAALGVAEELLPLRRVVVRTRPSNAAAVRVATSVGMQRAPDLDSDGFITYVTGEGRAL